MNHAIRVLGIQKRTTPQKSAKVVLADLRHSEEIDRMKLRLLGLEATIIAADEGFWDGVQQLVSDISQQMENCSGGV